MNNPECTPLSQAEELALMKAFPSWLSDQDETIARRIFEQLVFFLTIDRNTRRCVCTSCMEGFLVDKAIRPEFFKTKHGQVCECPNCGQRATLLSAGKYKNFNRLTSRQRAVQITVCQDWLLVQAGWLSRSFDCDDLAGYVDFVPFRRYAFAPGQRVMWGRRTVSWLGEWGVDGPWTRMDRIKEPFQRQPYEKEASYLPMGAANIVKSSLRYCQYDQWFDAEYGGVPGSCDWELEPFRVAYLIQYLGEYTRRPQMEILVKLGYWKIVSDLVLRRKPHGDILDWSAVKAPDFFRLSKHDFRLFRAGLCCFEDLKDFRLLQRRELVKDISEFSALKRGLDGAFSLVCKGARLAGVKLDRADRYIRSFEENKAVMAQIWVDYLEAAGKLKYDLSRDDVRLPAELMDRHDKAAAAIGVIEDEKKVKRYLARRVKLEKQFAFSADGLSIVVPGGVQDIVREGRILKHCVGGYADRHVDGKTTILFLRKDSAPRVPYVTIEINAENNCKNLRIVQIHGYRNDRDGRVSPEKKHAAFLDKWMAWVHAGSPRDEDGRPAVIPQSNEEMGAA